jgi:hypothetical protein
MYIKNSLTLLAQILKVNASFWYRNLIIGLHWEAYLSARTLTLIPPRSARILKIFAPYLDRMLKNCTFVGNAT